MFPAVSPHPVPAVPGSPAGLDGGRCPQDGGAVGVAVPWWCCQLHAQCPPTLLSPQKHPDFPKKPLTPYFRFFMEKRAKYAKLHPEMSNLDLTKILSKKYKELPEKKKVWGRSASPCPPCASVCWALPSSSSKTSRAQAVPGEGLIWLSMGEARCSFSPVRPVRLPWLFLCWLPGAVGWRPVGSVRWSLSP